MPNVTFHYDGQVKVVEAKDGKTILQIALENGIPMESACGGNGFCTTCLCSIKNGKKALEEGRVTAASEQEEVMGVGTPEKRLGCQARVRGEIEVSFGE
jgi:ferredoxin